MAEIIMIVAVWSGGGPGWSGGGATGGGGGGGDGGSDGSGGESGSEWLGRGPLACPTRCIYAPVPKLGDVVLFDYTLVRVFDTLLAALQPRRTRTSSPDVHLASSIVPSRVILARDSEYSCHVRKARPSEPFTQHAAARRACAAS